MGFLQGQLFVCQAERAIRRCEVASFQGWRLKSCFSPSFIVFFPLDLVCSDLLYLYYPVILL